MRRMKSMDLWTPRTSCINSHLRILFSPREESRHRESLQKTRFQAKLWIIVFFRPIWVLLKVKMFLSQVLLPYHTNHQRWTPVACTDQGPEVFQIDLHCLQLSSRVVGRCSKARNSSFVISNSLTEEAILPAIINWLEMANIHLQEVQVNTHSTITAWQSKSKVHLGKRGSATKTQWSVPLRKRLQAHL